jgi:hypothetical protein
MSKTLQQRTNHEGYPKAGELITMAGLENLEANQRAISNMLYQHAHESGRMAEPGAVFEIPMVSIRQELSKHESGDRLRASLVALARVVATVTYIDEDRGQQRVIVGGLFEFFDVAKQDLSPGTTLRYALNRNLVAIIDRSARWGRIRAEVYCAMRSRYAIALYEALALRRNMDRCIETFSIEKFREMMSVKPDTYRIGTDFQRYVISPAVLEVNGLSDMGVQMEVQRRHPRAPIHAVTVAWWRKSPEELAVVIRERNRSKIGRTARLKGMPKLDFCLD